MGWYTSGKDAYMEMAKLAYPDLDLENHPERSYYRNVFKQGLLAHLYRQSAHGLVSISDMDLETAIMVKKKITELFPVAQKYADEMADYPLKNKLQVNTMLGDKIFLYPDSADRLMRQGLNLRIQGGTAVLLAEGFYNILRSAKREGIVIQPIIVVHDSYTTYFAVKDILKIASFYYRNFTEYVYERHGIMYKFENKIGANYYDMTSFSMTSENSFKLSGSTKAIRLMFDKFKESNLEFETDIVLPEEDEIDLLSTFLGDPNSATFEKEYDYVKGEVKILNLT